MLWIQYKYQGETGFGQFNPDDSRIQPYSGNMFANPKPQGNPIKLTEVEILTPTQPSKMIALWNNYRALADEKGLSYPKTPLYLIKTPNTYLATGEKIQHPQSYTGEVFYEGELGIVIGKHANQLNSPKEAVDCIFGYTCINDVTAFGLLKEDPNFDQWTRAKGFDTFGVFGPMIATGLDSSTLEITTYVNGTVVQRYPADDMLMPPAEVVWHLSRNMSLLPGDIICCGTSIGLGPMERGCTVEVEINGIGKLSNLYQ